MNPTIFGGKFGASRGVAVLLGACLLLAAPRIRAISAARVGDVDGDGAVTLSDACLALQDALGLITLPTDQRSVAALGGKKPTTGNARSILRFVLGLESLPWIKGGDYLDGPLSLPDDSVVFTDYYNVNLTQVLPDGTSSVYLKTPGYPAAMRLRDDGHLIVSEFAGKLLDVAPDKSFTVLPLPKGKSLGDPYDVLLGPQGRIYVSGQGSGLIFLLKPDGTMAQFSSKLLRGTTGMAFTPDGRLRVADPFNGQIVDLPLDAAGAPMGSGKVWAKLPGVNGFRIDRLGRVWGASLTENHVYVFDPSGKLLRRITVPGTKASAVAFGPPGSRLVYITTVSPGYLSLLRISPADSLAEGLP